MKFGDVIENGWASEDNPIRFGIFVKYAQVRGGKTLYLTDGKGKFWHLSYGPKNKAKVVGTVLK